MHPTIPLSAPLDELLDAAKSRYDVRFEPVSIAGETLEILQIADLEALIDRLVQTAGQGPITLPYWAKIWPASMLLGHFLAHLGPGDGRTLLELGAGIGICGLFAAKRGFTTLITDIHPDALLFSQINILQNGLAGQASVAHADFAADRLGRRFDVILGSEVLYLEDLYRGLMKFLLAHIALAPEAEVVLAKDYTRKATRFLGMAEKEFHLSERVVGYKETNPESGEPERKLCQIYRLRPRKHV
uniref:Putative O-methyltransferase n=1 Tax=Desulfovibrio sp. U5L TaxID=596152 RepID=I2Q3I7_9BACT